MQVVHNQQSFLTLKVRKDNKPNDGSLQSSEKELLELMSDAFTIVYGGHFKRRKQSA